MAGKIYVGSNNVKLIVETYKDLTNVIEAKIYVRNPYGDVVVWNCEIDGTTLVHIIASDEIQYPGVYEVQAYVRFPDGSEYYGETANMYIYERFG